jgi:hypothetical protein
VSYIPPVALGLPWMPAASHGGQFAAPPPRQIVIHSTECPMTAGIAKSLAGPNWFGGPAAGTSPHGMFDPSAGVEEVHTDTIAWHCGNGNSTSVGYEHAGYAAFTRAEWTTDAGIAMLKASAKATAKVAKALGIPARWLSVAQVADNEPGFCTHNDMRLARGGTTHTDPGPNFPYDLYMQYVVAEMSGGTTDSPNPSDDDLEAWMASNEDAVRAIIRDELRTALKNDYGQISTRAAAKVRDMKKGTGSLWQHADAQGSKLQKLLDYFKIKVNG